MPRKRMQFTDEEAQRICIDMWLRMHDCDDEWRRCNLAFPADATSWQQRYELTEAARSALDAVYSALYKVAAEGQVAAHVRQWLQRYLSPAGWTRYLAAARQRKSKVISRSIQTSLNSWASSKLGKLADEVHLSKKDVFTHMMDFFDSRSGPGVDARNQFCEFVRAAKGSLP